MFKITALAAVIVAGMFGSAVSGYDVVSYFNLPQSKVGQPQQSPLPGNAAITAT